MKAKRDKFPMVIKRGSSVVRIYADEKPSGTYYRVVFHLGGKRQRLNFSSLEEAKTEAEAKAAQLARGDLDATRLSGEDRLVYGRALDALRLLQVPLDSAAHEYAEARKLLDGHSLLEAARFFMRHNGRTIRPKLVSDAVGEMIEAKSTKGVSALYLADLRYRLGAFRESFGCNVNALTPEDIRDWLLARKLSPRSHNNFLGTLKTFFAFAQSNGWLSKETDLLALAEKRKEKAAPVEIFTPKELGKLLCKASPELAPCLALAAFAGLRAEEILRLDWTDLERRPGFVEVSAHKAKTATRRLVPITDNLTKWLARAKRTSDRMWGHSKPWFFESMRTAASNAKVEWKQNALRHSFISYRLAELQDVNRVALEAGNSPSIIFKHYRELATPEQAKAWFSIIPDSSHP